MFEIKLCRFCGAYKLPGHTCDVTMQQRACADCTSYTLIQTMVTQPDGRVICHMCQGKARKLTAERAQMDMFGQQSLI